VGEKKKKMKVSRSRVECRDRRTRKGRDLQRARLAASPIIRRSKVPPYSKANEKNLRKRKKKKDAEARPERKQKVVTLEIATIGERGKRGLSEPVGFVELPKTSGKMLSV